jgi:hypothetical protein
MGTGERERLAERIESSPLINIFLAAAIAVLVRSSLDKAVELFIRVYLGGKLVNPALNPFHNF